MKLQVFRSTKSAYLLGSWESRARFQSDLYGNKIDLKSSWIFIGIFHAYKLGIDHNEWLKTITDKEILNEILD